MDVLEDLRIKGELVTPHGALVMGHVTEAGARKMGRAGACLSAGLNHSVRAEKPNLRDITPSSVLTARRRA